MRKVTHNGQECVQGTVSSVSVRAAWPRLCHPSTGFRLDCILPKSENYGTGPLLRGARVSWCQRSDRFALFFDSLWKLVQHALKVRQHPLNYAPDI
jgi:hypothetical protein